MLSPHARSLNLKAAASLGLAVLHGGVMAQGQVKETVTPALWMAEARKRQGLPLTIEDLTLLAKLAVLLRAPMRRPADE